MQTCDDDDDDDDDDDEYVNDKKENEGVDMLHLNAFEISTEIQLIMIKYRMMCTQIHIYIYHQ